MHTTENKIIPLSTFSHTKMHEKRAGMCLHTSENLSAAMYRTRQDLSCTRLFTTGSTCEVTAAGCSTFPRATQLSTARILTLSWSSCASFANSGTSSARTRSTSIFTASCCRIQEEKVSSVRSRRFQQQWRGKKYDKGFNYFLLEHLSFGDQGKTTYIHIHTKNPPPTPKKVDPLSPPSPHMLPSAPWEHCLDKAAKITCRSDRVDHHLSLQMEHA